MALHNTRFQQPSPNTQQYIQKARRRWYLLPLPIVTPSAYGQSSASILHPAGADGLRQSACTWAHLCFWRPCCAARVYLPASWKGTAGIHHRLCPT